MKSLVILEIQLGLSSAIFKELHNFFSKSSSHQGNIKRSQIPSNHHYKSIFIINKLSHIS